MIKPIVITDRKRKGRGFSLGEIKEAGVDIRKAKKLGFLVDRRRKTVYEENIRKLKELLKPPKPVKKKAVKEKISEEKPIKKETIEKEKKKAVKPRKKEEKKEKEILITEIKGVGKKTSEKLEKAGIKTVNDLLSSDTKNIAEKSGISEKKIEKLKENAKELL
ncbi:MAG: ribosomal protein L13e [Methanomicrobia archaeon]|nr:ribosomal protein L13e [Methanomicrobia archaeon]